MDTESLIYLAIGAATLIGSLWVTARLGRHRRALQRDNEALRHWIRNYEEKDG